MEISDDGKLSSNLIIRKPINNNNKQRGDLFQITCSNSPIQSSEDPSHEIIESYNIRSILNNNNNNSNDTYNNNYKSKNLLMAW
jgi:hypothetical protein